MPIIDGKGLDKLISGNRRDVRQIVALVRKVASGMADAHTAGIVHRDLKPANIMVNRQGEPVIIDFGLARSYLNEPGARITRSGAIVGSPAYMSPEQIRGEPGAILASSDIYSLGVILYELLTGRLPFDGTTTSVIAQVLTDPPPDPRHHRPDLDDGLRAICLRMLAKRPQERFASMTEVGSELKRYLQSGAPSTSTTTAPSSSPRQTAKEITPPAVWVVHRTISEEPSSIDSLNHAFGSDPTAVDEELDIVDSSQRHIHRRSWRHFPGALIGVVLGSLTMLAWFRSGYFPQIEVHVDSLGNRQYGVRWGQREDDQEDRDAVRHWLKTNLGPRPWRVQRWWAARVMKTARQNEIEDLKRDLLRWDRTHVSKKKALAPEDGAIRKRLDDALQEMANKPFERAIRVNYKVQKVGAEGIWESFDRTFRLDPGGAVPDEQFSPYFDE